MSMLAEQKRKQKFGPDPRNTFWGNDESKFGFRMLESMGWQKGKGLGAKENGMTEHIKVESRSNDDARGVGCSRKTANNWIPHQDDFNSILSSLNRSTNKDDDSSKPAETSVASVSLEQKSRSSRSRVHYHKFTRGKDLSSRSAHELACIFGKQNGQSSETSSPTVQSEANSDEEGSSDSKASSNSDDKEVPTYCVKTITSTSNVHEYFAMKMAELKQKREAASLIMNAASDDNNKDSETAEDTNNNSSKEDLTGLVNSDDSAPLDKQKKKKKKKKQKHDEEEDNSKCEEQLDVSSQDPENVPFETSQVADAVSEDKEQQLLKSKKKEKRKKKGVHDSALADSSINESADKQLSESDASREGRKSAKKIKKRKSSDVDHSESEVQEMCKVTDQNCTGEDICHEPEKKKKKKKKKKQKNTETEAESHNSSILRQENDGKTRRRKSVRFSVGEVEIFMIPNKEEEKMQQQEDEPVEKKSPKKRKRQMAQEEEESLQTEEAVPQTAEEKYVPPKKKRKSQDEGKETPKKKSKSKKVNQETKQDYCVENDLQVKSTGNDQHADLNSLQSDSSGDAENGKSKTGADNSACAGLSQKAGPKSRQAVSQARVDSICELFVGSNLSSAKGYGSCV